MAAAGFFGDGTGRPRLVWRLILYVLGFSFVRETIGAAVAIPVLLNEFASKFRYFRQHPNEAPKDAEDVFALIMPSLWLIMTIAAIPMTLGILGFTWISRRYLDQRDLASLGFRCTGTGLALGGILGVAAGMAPIALTVLILQQLGQVERVTFEAVTRQGLIMIGTLILMAFIEELSCRGYVLQNFIDSGRPVLGAVLGSVIFWLLHAANPHVWSSPIIAANLFLAGVLLTLAYLVSGDLWFPTALHFGWNFCQGIVLGLPVSGMPLKGWFHVEYAPGSQTHLTGGEFGLEGSAVALSVLLAEIVLLGAFLALRGSPVRPTPPLVIPPRAEPTG